MASSGCTVWPPSPFFRKDVILKCLHALIAQGCDSKGVAGAEGFHATPVKMGAGARVATNIFCYKRLSRAKPRIQAS